jgi:tetratricopeptide (TPR) repeat protein/cellulose biosynthesis protein BcsQ
MGDIVSFYSYKGGVGRTMALANVAALLAQWGHKTLVVDWDLEAPGLEWYFRPFLDVSATQQQPGLIDLLIESPKLPLAVSSWRERLIEVPAPTQKGLPRRGHLHLLTAGRREADYFRRVRSWDVDAFYADNYGGQLIESLREQWKEAYDFVLVDSRTGITDIGGVSTIQLPDILVMLFAANEQSLRGTAEVADSIRQARRHLPVDRLALSVLPLPSRFETSTEFEIGRGWLDRVAQELGPLFDGWLPAEIPADGLRQLLDIIKIPYIPFFSFGEKLPVVEQRATDPQGLAYAYETLAAMLANKLAEVDRLLSDRDGFVRGVKPAYDVFLSYALADADWAEALADELARLGLVAVPYHTRDLPSGDSLVLRVSADWERSRFLVLLWSKSTVVSEWSHWVWTRFLAEVGPGRIIPVLLDEVPLPGPLASLQAVQATHRHVGQVARVLWRRIGPAGQQGGRAWPSVDLGVLYPFVLRRNDRRLAVTNPDGEVRLVDDPLQSDDFQSARFAFRRLTGEAIVEDADRADLLQAAAGLGRSLFSVLFDEPGQQWLEHALAAGDRASVTISTDDEDLLELPWELLHDGQTFLVREGRLDVVRSTLNDVEPGTLLREPEGPFRLVLNVAAPSESGLDYEAEGYRITRTLTEACPVAATELGTVADLVDAVRRHRPVAVHFSGHGGQGSLVFEDDEGSAVAVSVVDLAVRLRREFRAEEWPRFFYLTRFRGIEEAAVAAARLHREGFTQVAARFGPVVDERSTRAEEALYAALASGRTARQAVREARTALLGPSVAAEDLQRDGGSAIVDDSYPFAWSQLVLYHRGPDFPLGTSTTAVQQGAVEQALRRTYESHGRGRILKTGFVNRRRELHRIRRYLLGEGKRVLVLQGLGGLGKSTLAFQVPPLLQVNKEDVCVFWCEGVEAEQKPVEALVGHLIEYGRLRLGSEWESLIQKVDRTVSDALQRFLAFLQALRASVPRLVLLLDNLESLLFGPADAASGLPDESAFAEWRTPELRALWIVLRGLAESDEHLWLLATCRYQGDDFLDVLLQVPPLTEDALFRLTGWFPTLQQLAPSTRARLVARLAGHPRSVEYAEDLIKHQLVRWRRTHGELQRSQPPTEEELEREWSELVEPALPQMQGQLWANLLLGEIWDQVLNEPMRRMLYRMTLLRRPWQWGLMAYLGEAGEDAVKAESVAEALCRTSLLESTERAGKPHYALHPATAAYVRQRFGDDETLRRQTHRRVGDYLEEQARTAPRLEMDLEAGYHLFEAGEYDRACELLVPASDWLQNHGRVREGLEILQPFLSEAVRAQMQKPLLGRMLGMVGLAYAALGQVPRAIDFYQQWLGIAREMGDHQGEANALGSLGSAYTALGQPQRAIDFHQQALAIYRDIHDRGGEGNALGNLGNAYRNLGQPEQALDFFQKRLAITRDLGDRQGEGHALGSLGLAYADLGEVQRAIEFYQQQLAIARDLGDRRGEADALGNLGSAYADLGRPQRAIEFHQQQLAIARDLGDRQGEGRTLGNLGIAYFALGQPERAIDFYRQQLAIARDLGDRRGEAIACWNLGLQLAKLGPERLTEAIALMDVCVRFQQEIGHPDAESQAAHVEQLRQQLAGLDRLG